MQSSLRRWRLMSLAVSQRICAQHSSIDCTRSTRHFASVVFVTDEVLFVEVIPADSAATQACRARRMALLASARRMRPPFPITTPVPALLPTLLLGGTLSAPAEAQLLPLPPALPAALLSPPAAIAPSAGTPSTQEMPPTAPPLLAAPPTSRPAASPRRVMPVAARPAAAATSLAAARRPPFLATAAA